MRLSMILIVGAIAIFATGCGGGGDSTSGDSTPDGTAAAKAEGDGKAATIANPNPSNAKQLIAGMNEICEQVPVEYNELVQKHTNGGQKGVPKAQLNLKAAVPPLHTAIERMEGITPPAGEEQKLQNSITALEKAATGLEDQPSSELTGPKSPFAEFQKVSRENGYQACAAL